MNNDDAILAELRKLSAWADTQRKINKRVSICLAVFLPCSILFVIVMEHHHFNAEIADIQASDKAEKPTWSDVGFKTRSGDFDGAMKLGEELILKTPQFPDGHQRLATAYLAAGKIQQARDHFAEAFRLFPSEENEKLLAAIDKRLKASTADSNR